MKKTLILAVGTVIATVLIGLAFKPRRETTPMAPASAQKAAGSVDQPEPAALPAPSVIPPPTASTWPEAAPQQTVVQRIARNDSTVFKLAPEQIQAFLAKNRTNAESLLTAFEVTSDKAFLREAARRYPSNTFVLAAVLARDALPEQRRELIEQFKQAAPDNPLANYLSARDYSKHQQPELALKEFAEASGKNDLRDFSVERLQGLEEVYLAAGHSAGEAKALAMARLDFPYLSQLRDVGRDMSALEQQYLAAGDSASAQTLARMGVGFAANVTTAGANTLLSQMLGMGVERYFLNGLDPNLSYDFLPQPVNERLAYLQEQAQSIREEATFFEQWQLAANDGQLVSYFDRLKLYGQAAALNWARVQSADVPPAP